MALLPTRQRDQILLMVIVLSVLPSALHVWKENRREILAWLRARVPGR